MHNRTKRFTALWIIIFILCGSSPITFASRLSVNASFNAVTKEVTISGKTTLGPGMWVTIIVTDPQEGVSYIGRMLSEKDGAYTIKYTLDTVIEGTYKVRVNSVGIDEPQSTTFASSGTPQATPIPSMSPTPVPTVTPTPNATFTSGQVSCVAGKEFNFAIRATNVSFINNVKYVITYDTTNVNIVDLSVFTPNMDMFADSQTENVISDTNIKVKQSTSGSIKTIILSLTDSVESDKAWSGIVNIIRFKPNVTGSITINVSQQ